ncbi:sugar-transfer associated ATP-grasp domain-containing protein [uncultured Winogradskyella sp.]|uniref:sugar-transfer associated ATP-grasp domain-containing protein n=1 Tax=uncultured Winogradskyella sp. TaxID=395353 RepID=UPI0026260D24|nr:sugar-transfer associated ATP-grasp domain-containing protein [uncultured Winogradskyella sp.]
MKFTYYKYRTKINIVKKDLKDKFPLGISKKIDLWRKGFLAEKYTLYQLDKNNYKDYLSDYHAAMARWINEPFNELLTNKLIFSECVGKHIKVPKTFGIFVSGEFFSNDNRTLNELIIQFDIFVVKTVSGGGGKGVHIIENKNNDEFLLNNTKSYNSKELLEFFTSLNNYIFTEFIEPSDFSKSLNAASVNTMRIITLIDPITNRAFIARAVQRIGVAASAPQDNFTKGGLSAAINIETGILSDCTRHPKTKEHNRYTHHPDTNIKIEGVAIPNWQSIKEEIIQTANRLPMLKCVGWDFVLSNKGLVAIEGNHHPDPDVLQGHEPLLTDERIKAFYKFHKII